MFVNVYLGTEQTNIMGQIICVRTNKQDFITKIKGPVASSPKIPNGTLHFARKKLGQQMLCETES